MKNWIWIEGKCQHIDKPDTWYNYTTNLCENETFEEAKKRIENDNPYMKFKDLHIITNK